MTNRTTRRAAAAPVADAAPVKMMRVADVARAEGINPKIARARLRRTFFGTKGTLAQRGIVTGRWEFAADNLPVILAHIRTAS